MCLEFNCINNTSNRACKTKLMTNAADCVCRFSLTFLLFEYFEYYDCTNHKLFEIEIELYVIVTTAINAIIIIAYTPCDSI